MLTHNLFTYKAIHFWRKENVFPNSDFTLFLEPKKIASELMVI